MQNNSFILPDWMIKLPMQQQSVLILGLRGPDGIRKNHPMKDLQRHYRGTVLKAAKFGRSLKLGEKADSFMSMEYICNPGDFDLWPKWTEMIKEYFYYIDELPHHFHLHLMHGAQILGYKHPNYIVRSSWSMFYYACVDDAHLNVETEEQMDARLCDWNHQYWD